VCQRRKGEVGRVEWFNLWGMFFAGAFMIMGFVFVALKSYRWAVFEFFMLGITLAVGLGWF
jgi:uncharacterized phage infection (PIP) family protein YhgE